MMIRKLLGTVCVVAGVFLASADSRAATSVNVTPDGVAIGGWDTVAYFTENRAVEGSADFSHEWNGALWLFSSAANRDLFAGDPEAYAPQFGGWCAYALSQGKYAAEVEPDTAWTVHEGLLYLNWNEKIRKRWSGNNLENGISVGRQNWTVVEPQVVEGSAKFNRKSDSPWNN